MYVKLFILYAYVSTLLKVFISLFFTLEIKSSFIIFNPDLAANSKSIFSLLNNLYKMETIEFRDSTKFGKEVEDIQYGCCGVGSNPTVSTKRMRNLMMGGNFSITINL